VNILIVEARYHSGIAEALADGASRALEQGGARFERVAVPGALEIPTAIALAARAHRFAGFVALGSVVQSGTPHFDLIAQNTALALTRMGVDHGLCIGNGIIVAVNEEDAMQMAATDGSDAGGEAARACLALVALANRLGEET
jgi:6,7-dimethyl-8-ribityllumazine synthase